MKNTFKIGDKVRLLEANAKAHIPFIGKIYTLEEDSYFAEDGENEYIRVRILGDNAPLRTFFVRRFELVKDKIEIDSLVKATRSVGVSVVKGKEYRVQKIVDERLVKLYGISNYMLIDAFELSQNKVPVPKAPKKADDEAVKFLKELTAKVGEDPGTCSFAMLYEGDKKEFKLRAACHAQLRGQHKRLKAVVDNVSGHYAVVDNKEAYREWVQYITQESPWKNAFIPMSVDEIIKDGVIMNLECSHNEIASAMIALRVGSEHSNNLALFTEVVELGFSKEVAFVVSAFFTGSQDSFRYHPNSSWHHVLHFNQDVNQIASFFKKGFTKPMGPPMRESNQGGFVIAAKIADLLVEGSPDNVRNLVSKIPGINETKGGWGESSFNITGPTALVKICSTFCKVI